MLKIKYAGLYLLSNFRYQPCQLCKQHAVYMLYMLQVVDCSPVVFGNLDMLW